MRLMHALLGLLGLLVACAPVETAPAQVEPVTITLTRGVCFGFCPDYTVSIDQDGNVSYEGRRFVAAVGRQSAQIPRAEVEALLARFEAVQFMNLREEYRANISDLPTYTITLTRGAMRKRVSDYGGTRVGLPAAVRELQDEIDRVAGTARWVLRDGEPVRGGQER